MSVAPRFFLVICFLFLSIVAKADPISVTAGSSATLIFTSSTNTAARAEATYALSADGRTVTMNFKNTSTDANIGLWAIDVSSNTSYFNQLSDYKWVSNISGLPTGFSWTPSPTDNFETNTFASRSITSLLDITLFKQVGFRGQDFAAYSFLAMGQGGIATLSFSGTTNGIVNLPLTSFTIGSVYAGFVIKTGDSADFITSSAGTTTSFSIPEPATLLLLGTGLAALGIRMRRA